MKYIHKILDYLKQLNNYWNAKTQPIQGKTNTEKLQDLEHYYKLNSGEKKKLENVQKLENGQKFINFQIDKINHYASHRTAFVLNAVIQFFMLNLSSIGLLSFVPSYWFKIIMVGSNCLIALLAWLRIRAAKRALLLGLDAEPKWTFLGIFSGNRRKHNKHIIDKAEPYRVMMRDGRLFTAMYVVNAITIFFGHQLIFSEYLPSLISSIINIPLFIFILPLTLINGYWAFVSGNQVSSAAIEFGKKLDQLKL